MMRYPGVLFMQTALLLSMAAGTIRAQASADSSPAPAPRTATISAPSNVQASVGDSVRVPLVLNGAPNGGQVVLEAVGAAGAVIDAQRVLRWRARRGNIGSVPVTIVAKTGQDTLARATITIAVTNADRAPVLRGVGDMAVPLGGDLRRVVTAVDQDDDAPFHFTVANLTNGSPPPSIDDNGVLTWTAPSGAANTGRVVEWRITVTDATGRGQSEDVHVQVTGRNVAPSCYPEALYTTSEGSVLEFPMEARDANNDPLRFLTRDRPANVAVVQDSIIRWSVPYGTVPADRGDAAVRFSWIAVDTHSDSTASQCGALVTVRGGVENIDALWERQAQILANMEVARRAFALEAAHEARAGEHLRRSRVNLTRTGLGAAAVGGLFQFAKPEGTRTIAAGVASLVSVLLGGIGTTLDDPAPSIQRAEAARQRASTLAFAQQRFIANYGQRPAAKTVRSARYQSDIAALQETLDKTRAP